MRLIALTIISFIGFLSLAQVGTGQWRMHVPSTKAIDVDAGDGNIFACLPNTLVSYDIASGEITQRNNVNYLSDIELSAIAFDSISNQLFIGYKTGNIDILKDEEIINLPFIKTAELTGDKKIYDIQEHGNLIYLATGFGIVVLDPNKLEVKDTYYPNSLNDAIVNLEIANDTIYALSKQGLKKGLVSNNFLADPTQWITDNRLIPYPTDGEYEKISVYKQAVYLSYNHIDYGIDTVFNITDGTVFLKDFEINSVQAINDKLTVGVEGGLNIYDATGNLEQNIYQYSSGIFPSAEAAIFVDGYYYIADNNNGLTKAQNAFGSSRIGFDGPKHNSSYRLDWGDGVISVAGGKLAGSNPSFSNDGLFTFKNETWTAINKTNQSILQNAEVWDFISTEVNPKNGNQIAIGTYSNMPLMITNSLTNISDTFSVHNSYLEETSLGNGWVYISDLEYDKDGNLWVLNGYANKPLKMLSKDGIWYEFETASPGKNKFSKSILIDSKNIKWFGIKGAGVIGYDDNNTLDDTSDDRTHFFSTGENSGNLASNSVNVLTEDLDGEIWAGCTEGLRILYNPSSALEPGSTSTNFQKLVIKFEEDNEEVLGGVNVKAIVVDGANRKWIGTENSGLFLFSEDGLEVLKEFNTENSPLTSNSIFDLALDENTGELFIATGLGLISYRTDASIGDSEYENVNVFPNPVVPGYDGLITIQGIASESDIKITDISGNLVYSTTSYGGTATWNGKTIEGKRAATGVYLIWTAPRQEKGRKVGKVVFIN